MKLPSLAIAPVYRADGSGTTFVFTDYLSMLSTDWKSQVGSSTSVKWAAGTGAKGSDGVSGTVHNIKGGIGYVESAYAEMNHLTTTQLQNNAGKFVSPSMDSYKAAAASADWSSVKNFAIDLNNQPGDASWPIESATFVLLPTDPKDPNHSAAVKKFFDWGFAHGNDIATQLLYIPLPATVQNAVPSSLAKGSPRHHVVGQSCNKPSLLVQPFSLVTGAMTLGMRSSHCWPAAPVRLSSCCWAV